MTTTIRPVGPGEHAELGELTLAVYRQVLASELEGYAPILRDVAGRLAGGCQVLVAAAGGRLLGGVTYVPGPGPLAPLAADGEAELRMLVVDPPAQGQGVGSALVRACLDLAGSQHREGVVLGTMPEMAAAHRLYRRLGFQRSPGRDRQIASGQPLWCFSLALEPASPSPPP
ncbi:MAG TPA: GNAT family N-acetyltransferase [Acidimicrobiales bacterium]|nr:GNAT family N-acetyltransferase [Acidimicrobiales bacterium]